MTDASQIKKPKGDWGSWRNKPYGASRSDEAQRRAQLWAAFNDFVRENRGWITSPPGSRTATLEVEQGSALPDRLARLGYQVSKIPGEFERLTGAAPTPAAERLKRRGHAVSEPCAGPIMQVLHFSVELPWGAPPAPP